MIILWLLKLGITMLIHNKGDIEFVTEFPCFLGHPEYYDSYIIFLLLSLVLNNLTNNGRRHSKLFTNCRVSWDTLYNT